MPKGASKAGARLLLVTAGALTAPAVAAPSAPTVIVTPDGAPPSVRAAGAHLSQWAGTLDAARVRWVPAADDAALREAFAERAAGEAQPGVHRVVWLKALEAGAAKAWVGVLKDCIERGDHCTVRTEHATIAQRLSEGVGATALATPALSIAVVTPDEFYQRQLGRALEAAGYQVRSLSGPARAKEPILADTQRIDLFSMSAAAVAPRWRLGRRGRWAPILGHVRVRPSDQRNLELRGQKASSLVVVGVQHPVRLKLMAPERVQPPRAIQLKIELFAHDRAIAPPKARLPKGAARDLAIEAIEVHWTPSVGSGAAPVTTSARRAPGGPHFLSVLPEPPVGRIEYEVVLRGEWAQKPLLRRRKGALSVYPEPIKLRASALPEEVVAGTRLDLHWTPVDGKTDPKIAPELVLLDEDHELRVRLHPEDDGYHAALTVTSTGQYTLRAEPEMSVAIQGLADELRVVGIVPAVAHSEHALPTLIGFLLGAAGLGALLYYLFRPALRVPVEEAPAAPSAATALEERNIERPQWATPSHAGPSTETDRTQSRREAPEATVRDKTKAEGAAGEEAGRAAAATPEPPADGPGPGGAPVSATTLSYDDGGARIRPAGGGAPPSDGPQRASRPDAEHGGGPSKEDARRQGPPPEQSPEEAQRAGTGAREATVIQYDDGGFRPKAVGRPEDEALSSAPGRPKPEDAAPGDDAPPRRPPPPEKLDAATAIAHALEGDDGEPASDADLEAAFKAIAAEAVDPSQSPPEEVRVQLLALGSVKCRQSVHTLAASHLLSRGATIEHDYAYGAQIRIKIDGFEGTLAIVADAAASERLARGAFELSEDEAASDQDIDDSLAELANILQGAMISVVGEAPELGIPDILRGADAASLSALGCQQTLGFEDGQGEFALAWLD